MICHVETPDWHGHRPDVMDRMSLAIQNPFTNVLELFSVIGMSSACNKILRDMWILQSANSHRRLHAPDSQFLDIAVRMGRHGEHNNGGRSAESAAFRKGMNKLIMESCARQHSIFFKAFSTERTHFLCDFKRRSLSEGS